MLLFTYGTLRPSLYPRVINRFKLTPVSRAFLPGFKMYNLGRFPCIVPDLAKGNRPILGELVEVADLATIDRYEGYTPGGKGFYDRQAIQVTKVDGELVEAVVYYMPVMPKRYTRPRVVTSGDWATQVKERR